MDFFSSAYKQIYKFLRSYRTAETLQIPLFLAINIKTLFLFFVLIASSDLYDWKKNKPSTFT